MRRILVTTGSISLACSVVSVVLVERYLNARIPVLGAFAGFQKSHNPGIAFGIKLPSGFQEIIIGIALLLVGYLAWTSVKTKWSAIGFGLILGGGIANIVDRIPDGLVTDMIQVGSFPIFNLADSCITVGAFLLLVEVVLQMKTHH